MVCTRNRQQLTYLSCGRTAIVDCPPRCTAHRAARRCPAIALDCWSGSRVAGRRTSRFALCDALPRRFAALRGPLVHAGHSSGRACRRRCGATRAALVTSKTWAGCRPASPPATAHASVEIRRSDTRVGATFSIPIAILAAVGRPDAHRHVGFLGVTAIISVHPRRAVIAAVVAVVIVWVLTIS